MTLKAYKFAIDSISTTSATGIIIASSDTDESYHSIFKNNVNVTGPTNINSSGFEDVAGGRSQYVTLSNLSANSSYVWDMWVRDASGAESAKYTLKFTTPKLGSANVVSSYNDASAKDQDAKSLLKLSNPNKDRKKYVIAEKQMDKLDISQSYFSFGTTLFMKASSDTTYNSGGIMMFSTANGLNGYYISIQSADSADFYGGQKAFRILKIQNGKLTKITDSQDSQGGKIFGAIYNGEAYKVDVFIKASPNKIDITAYINGFKITATDTTSSNIDAASNPNFIMSPTNMVSLVSAEGTIYFDYVYAKNITEEEYKNRSSSGKDVSALSSSLINSAFGEKVLSNPTQPDSNVNLEEFGTVAREIRSFKFKYSSPPANPRYATTGGNSRVTILSQDLTSHGAELYVMNNSGTYVPLADGDSNSLWVIGKRIYRTGEIEYVNDPVNKFGTPRPVIFQSTWLQNNEDVVKLADWIKVVWSKKQSIINLSITGNPLISVGDVITINYPYHGLDGTAKLLVTRVTQSYSEGLDTQITCRTL